MRPSGSRRRRTGGRLRALVVVASVCLPALAGPAVAVPAEEDVDPVQPVDPSLEAFGLTQDEDDTYALTVEGNSVTTTAAPDNVGTNTRIMFRPASALPTVNQQSCATWDSTQVDVFQPGAALRFLKDDDFFRALMISQNIYGYAIWTFNVHLVDTSQERPIIQVAQFDLRDTFAPDGTYDSLAPAPWRICVRAVGLELVVKVWSLQHPEPEWGDERYGGVVDLPDGWDYAGHSGWYIGHLHPAGSASLSDLETTGLALRSLEQRVRNQVAAAAVVWRP